MHFSMLFAIILSLQSLDNFFFNDRPTDQKVANRVMGQIVRQLEMIRHTNI